MILYTEVTLIYLSSTSGTCTPQPEIPGVTVPRSTTDGPAVSITRVLITWTTESSESHVDRSCCKDVFELLNYERHETGLLAISITLRRASL